MSSVWTKQEAENSSAVCLFLLLLLLLLAEARWKILRRSGHEQRGEALKSNVFIMAAYFSWHQMETAVMSTAQGIAGRHQEQAAEEGWLVVRNPKYLQNHWELLKFWMCFVASLCSFSSCGSDGHFFSHSNVGNQLFCIPQKRIPCSDFLFPKCWMINRGTRRLSQDHTGSLRMGTGIKSWISESITTIHREHDNNG